MEDINSPLIIPIIGKARAGKDTFALMLKDALEKEAGKKAIVVKYADYLKFICKEYFGWNGEKDDAGRTILQYMGTDVCRKNNPDIWVAVVHQLIKGLSKEFDYVLIPDTRFQNEIDFWDRNSFSTVPVRIKRQNEDGTDYDNGLTDEQKNHPSEISLDDFIPFYQIEASSLEQLTESVDVVCQNIVKNF